jgi:predicted small metal-binding protein
LGNNPEEILDKPERKEVIKMAENLKSISCDPICGFMVRSHDENELVEMIKAHGKNKHPDMKLTDEEIKAMIKPA